MNFTTILIEHLISGFQAGIWIVLLILNVTGLDFNLSGHIDGLDGAVGLIFILTPFAYPVGIAIDSFADTMLRRWHDRIKYRHTKNTKHSTIGLIAQINNPYFGSYLENLRSRIKLTRATALNGFLIAINALFFIIVRTNSDTITKVAHSLVVIAMFTLLIIAMLLAWRRNTISYYVQSKKVIDYLKDHKPY